jgi:hypothetical protein
VHLPLADGAAALVLFVLRERRTQAALVPMSLFRNLACGAANAAGILMTASIFGAAFSLAPPRRPARIRLRSVLMRNLIVCGPATLPSTPDTKQRHVPGQER